MSIILQSKCWYDKRWKTEELRLLIKGGQRGMKTNYSDYPGLNPGLQDKKVKNDIIWDNW